MYEIPELDSKGLRQFGITTGGIVAVLFGLLTPWLIEVNFPIWPWIIFGVLTLWALIAPSTLKNIYLGWMRLGLLLGRITTPLVLGIVFFLLFAPMAFFMRLIKRDPMKRQLDPTLKSYRQTVTKPEKNNMEYPF